MRRTGLKIEKCVPLRVHERSSATRSQCKSDIYDIGRITSYLVHVLCRYIIAVAATAAAAPGGELAERYLWRGEVFRLFRTTTTTTTT